MNFIIAVVTTVATISTAADKANHLSCEQIVKKKFIQNFFILQKSFVHISWRHQSLWPTWAAKTTITEPISIQHQPF